MESFPRYCWIAALTVILLVAAACSSDEPAPATEGGASASVTAGGGHDDGDHHGHGTTMELGEGMPTMEAGHDHDTGDPHDHEHDHGDTGAATQYDADVADADQTISVGVVDGGPEGGVRRVAVDRGSVVALRVTSDTAEEVHVHGYDILRAVSGSHPAHFAFTAEIPGVFEVELEGSGRLLLQLEIS